MCCLWFDVGLLCDDCCVMIVVRRLTVVSSCSLFVVCCQWFAFVGFRCSRCVLSGVRCAMFVVVCLLFVWGVRLLVRSLLFVC